MEAMIQHLVISLINFFKEMCVEGSFGQTWEL